tara:strand:- start:12076 stop:12990 length:915 start_codon:yes stop_codon:yes gene_type:complete
VKIYKSIEDFSSEICTIITIGTFDGVHKGHQKILNRINEIANKEGLESVLLTFYPHPRHVLFDDNYDFKLINTIDEKIQVLTQTNLKHLVIHEFSKEFSRTESVHFIRDILVNKLNMKYMVVGHDHHFGKNREGTYDNLLELSEVYDFKLEKIAPEDVDGVTISSTKVRAALLEGRVKVANSLLGYNYFFSGKVIHGEKLGRTIGFPTANIELENCKLLPKSGVYAVKLVITDCHYFGMLNIGLQTNKIEAYIFDFSEQIYGQNISVHMFSRIRDGKKMGSLKALKEQLIKDEHTCRSLFKMLK